MRPRIVEQQEGADVPIQRVIGKERADRETIAHPMAAFVAVAAEDRLVHRSSPDRATPQWGALDLEGTWTCIAEDERRSAERRVGKECVRKGRAGWWQYH